MREYQCTYIHSFTPISCTLDCFLGLSSSLTHIDWNDASDKLIVNSEAFELKYLNVTQRKDIPASACADESWSTCTSPFGWCTKGIFPGIEGIDVNSCTRSNNRKVIATGDDFGRVNIFAYPACVAKQTHHSYIGHASHVTRVKFSSDDKFLLTTGGSDRTILVWKTDNLIGDNGSSHNHPLEKHIKSVVLAEDEDLSDLGLLSKKEKKVGAEKFGKQKQASSNTTSKVEEEEDFFGAEQADQGDEFM